MEFMNQAWLAMYWSGRQRCKTDQLLCPELMSAMTLMIWAKGSYNRFKGETA